MSFKGVREKANSIDGSVNLIKKKFENFKKEKGEDVKVNEVASSLFSENLFHEMDDYIGIISDLEIEDVQRGKHTEERDDIRKASAVIYNDIEDLEKLFKKTFPNQAQKQLKQLDGIKARIREQLGRLEFGMRRGQGETMPLQLNSDTELNEDTQPVDSHKNPAVDKADSQVQSIPKDSNVNQKKGIRRYISLTRIGEGLTDLFFRYLGNKEISSLEGIVEEAQVEKLNDKDDLYLSKKGICRLGQEINLIKKESKNKKSSITVEELANHLKQGTTPNDKLPYKVLLGAHARLLQELPQSVKPSTDPAVDESSSNEGDFILKGTVDLLIRLDELGLKDGEIEEVINQLGEHTFVGENPEKALEAAYKKERSDRALEGLSKCQIKVEINHKESPDRSKIRKFVNRMLAGEFEAGTKNKSKKSTTYKLAVAGYAELLSRIDDSHKPDINDVDKIEQNRLYQQTVRFLRSLQDQGLQGRKLHNTCEKIGQSLFKNSGNINSKRELLSYKIGCRQADDEFNHLLNDLKQKHADLFEKDKNTEIKSEDAKEIAFQLNRLVSTGTVINVNLQIEPEELLTLLEKLLEQALKSEDGQFFSHVNNVIEGVIMPQGSGDARGRMAGNFLREVKESDQNKVNHLSEKCAIYSEKRKGNARIAVFNVIKECFSSIIREDKFNESHHKAVEFFKIEENDHLQETFDKKNGAEVRTFANKTLLNLFEKGLSSIPGFFKDARPILQDKMKEKAKDLGFELETIDTYIEVYERKENRGDIPPAILAEIKDYASLLKAEKAVKHWTNLERLHPATDLNAMREELEGVLKDALEVCAIRFDTFAPKMAKEKAKEEAAIREQVQKTENACLSVFEVIFERFKGVESIAGENEFIKFLNEQHSPEKLREELDKRELAEIKSAQSPVFKLFKGNLSEASKFFKQIIETLPKNQQPSEDDIKKLKTAESSLIKWVNLKTVGDDKIDVEVMLKELSGALDGGIEVFKRLKEEGSI